MDNFMNIFGDIASRTEIDIIMSINTLAHLHAMEFIISASSKSDVEMSPITVLVIYEYEFYTRFTKELNNLGTISETLINAYKTHYEPRMLKNMLYISQKEKENAE